MASKATTTYSIPLAFITLAAAFGISYGIKRVCSSSDDSCAAESSSKKDLKNSAFVFIKPHANTRATQTLVKTKLNDAGITIISESSISGDIIDERKLIDQHYYAIASKATILTPDKIPVPADKFEATFNESWETVLKENRACNAMDACKRFDCTADELDTAWGSESTKTVKFGGGFYCGLVKYKGKQPLYIFNAFFMAMRSKFVGEDTSIHCYEIEWDPSTLSWSNFRNELLGPTDPAVAPATSIRRTILETYKELGLESKPNKGDNGVHASASPFEGLAEKTNWLGIDLSKDSFGKALLDSGIPKETIKEWSVDPRVHLPEADGGGKGSVFDALEDMDVADCLMKLVTLNELNADVV